MGYILVGMRAEYWAVFLVGKRAGRMGHEMAQELDHKWADMMVTL